MRVLGSLDLVANSEVVGRAPESCLHLPAESETPGKRYGEVSQNHGTLFVQSWIEVAIYEAQFAAPESLGRHAKG